MKREPQPDMTPTYKTGDKLRVNPSGSITLLRAVPDARRFVACVTWEADRLPPRVKRVLKTP